MYEERLRELVLFILERKGQIGPWYLSLMKQRICAIAVLN